MTGETVMTKSSNKTTRGLACKLVSFRTQEEGAEYIHPCTMDSLQSSITKTAWNIFQQVEGVMYDGYEHGYPDKENPSETDYSTVWLVDNKSGRIVEHLSRIHGFSEWSAIKYICQRHFKRGRVPSDFTIVFVRLSDESNHRTVKCTKGIPWYAFSE